VAGALIWLNALCGQNSESILAKQEIGTEPLSFVGFLNSKYLNIAEHQEPIV
jgi:hypothetical protein